MATIDELVNGAIIRADNETANADNVIIELRSFIDRMAPYITMNAPELGSYTIQPYVAPAKDTTPTPVYEPPTAMLPNAPVLTDASNLTLPPTRVAPELDTANLFKHVQPSTNIAEFNEAAPDLGIDALVEEMHRLATPALKDFAFPDLSNIVIGAMPDINIPAFDPPATPDRVRDPVDYAKAFADNYNRMTPAMQSWVEDRVQAWVQLYAPEYNDWIDGLRRKVNTGLDGGVLPDQFEQAMFVRAQGRINEEFMSQEAEIEKRYERAGMIDLPGFRQSAELQTRMTGKLKLADQATDIYIERRKAEVQHIQFVMNLASTQIQSLRSIAVQYAGLVNDVMRTSIEHSTQYTDRMIKIYDHLIDRAKLDVAILEVLNAQYEVKLKAALAALNKYQVELETAKLRVEIDKAKIEFVETQIRAEGLKVANYTALIESITKRGELEQLKLKEYEVKADIYKVQLQARVASWEMYKAAMEGDEAKMRGELAKLQAFEAQLRADMTVMETQSSVAKVVMQNNEIRGKIYEVGADVYRTNAEAALRKFTTEMELKKLGVSIYGQELANAIEKYKIGVEYPRLMIEAVLKQYELAIRVAEDNLHAAVDTMKIAENASVAAVGAYGNIAQASIGALNTMVSDTKVQ